MNWLAFGPIQTGAIWLVAGASALWLYLHQRPVLRRVSTLRFWAELPPSVYRRRRWLREPWAFVAQLFFLLFVILALANPRWGQLTESRRVALVLDTSIWSQVQPSGQAPWIDRIRQQASQVLNSLPVTDEVLLLRAEGDAAPVLAFNHDRIAQLRAVASTRMSSSNADVPRALDAARAALAGSTRALLVYVGPGMLDEQQMQRFQQFREEIAPANGTGDKPQFLVRLMSGSSMIENRGILRLALQRETMQPDHWHLLTQLRNYSDVTSTLTLNLSFGGQTLLKRSVSLAPGQLSGLKDDFTTAEGGLLQAEITPSDDLPADDRALVYVPPFRPIRVAVFSERAAFENELRPVLSANPYLWTDFIRPGEAPKLPPDVEIHDGGDPSSQSTVNSVFFIKGRSAVATHSIRMTAWNSQHPVTRWVRTHDVTVRNAAVIGIRPSDIVLASGEGSPPLPLIVAREEQTRKVLIVGFDPSDSNFPQQSAFPLLMAGSVEWLTHPVEDVSESVSAGELDLPGLATRIVSPSGVNLPFARNTSSVHLLALQTGIYRVIGPNRSATYAVNAPALMPSRQIDVAPEQASSIAFEGAPSPGQYLWTWLSLLAILALWMEWWLFYTAAVNRPLEPAPSGGERPGQWPEPESIAQNEEEAFDPKVIT